MRRLWRSFGALVLVASLGCGGGASVVQKSGPEDMMARAERALEKGNELLAIETLTRITTDYPGVAFIDRVVFLLGRAHLQAKEYAEAEVEFQRIEKDYPFSEFADDALFLVGECYFRQRGTPQHDPTLAETAVRRYESFLREYPDSPLATEARSRIEVLHAFLAEKLYLNARQYFRRGRHRAVEIYVNSLLEKYPATPSAPPAILLMAKAREKLDDRRGACEALERLSAMSGSMGEEDRAEAARCRAEWGCGAAGAAEAEPQAGG